MHEGTQTRTLPALKALDIDDAIRERDDAIAGDTRADFFTKAALGGGAVIGAGGVMSVMAGSASAVSTPALCSSATWRSSTSP